MMLEKVEMTPRDFRKVMGFAERIAFWAWIAGPSFSLDVKTKFAGPLVHIQLLTDNLPRRGQTKTKGKKIVGIHG
jgi:hypothetical protein